MALPKPHQSAVCFEKYIYCFGIPDQRKVNIERYNIETDRWEDVIVSNFLSNPFNFASGFAALQINHSEILFFGGKKFL